MPSKIDLVNGAYQLIRISGLTSNAVPEEISIGVQVADDLAGELSTTLDTGYIQPSAYGDSDPNDYSGLTAQTAGPFKKLLAMELVDFFGKEVPISLKMNADKGLRALEQLLVVVNPMQNPGTLPMGSGNDYDYRGSRFYPEPVSDDSGVYRYKSDVFQLPLSWVQWLAGVNTLASVDYEFDDGVLLGNESIDTDNGSSNATVSFYKVGQFTLCAKATDDQGNTKTEKFIYNVTECAKNYYP